MRHPCKNLDAVYRVIFDGGQGPHPARQTGLRAVHRENIHPCPANPGIPASHPQALPPKTIPVLAALLFSVRLVQRPTGIRHFAMYARYISSQMLPLANRWEKAVKSRVL